MNLNKLAWTHLKKQSLPVYQSVFGFCRSYVLSLAREASARTDSSLKFTAINFYHHKRSTRIQLPGLCDKPGLPVSQATS